MLTEKGTLPGGVEFDGQIHKEFEIREQLVRDGVAVYDDPDRAARAEKNDAYMGLCILAGQVLSLGSIPKDSISPELLMDMSQEDFNALNDASGRLTVRRASFRSEA